MHDPWMRLFTMDLGEPHARRVAADCRRLGAGETWPVAHLAGPGCVRSLRVEGDWQTPGLVLRCFWDDEPSPSIEVPLAALLGGGQTVASAMLWATQGGPAGLHAAMPFLRDARIEIANLGPECVLAPPLHLQIDYDAVRDEDARQPPATFHAQWFRTADSPRGCPLQACHATGHGAYLGCLVSPAPGSEAPIAPVRDTVWVDGEGRSQLLGAQAPQASSVVTIGAGPLEGCEPVGSGAGAYRLRPDRPLAFRSSLWVCLPGQPEGAAAAGLWYQHEPHREVLMPLAPEHLTGPAAPGRGAPPRAQERVEWLVDAGDRKVVSHNHLLDLSPLAAPSGGSSVALSAALTCAETRTAQLYLSYEGLARVLFDGTLLFERERAGGFGLDPIAMMITAGQHAVQLELAHQGEPTCGIWAVGFRVANSEGRTQHDVGFAEYPEVEEL